MPKDVNTHRKRRDGVQHGTPTGAGSPGWRETVYAEIAARERARDADAKSQISVTPPAKRG